jgi:hypothetical protein
MKVRLLHPESDFDGAPALPVNADDLAQDLELTTVWNAMAQGEKLLFEVSRQVMLHPLVDAGEIGYRQEILRDCLEHRDSARELYRLADDAVNAPKRIWGFHIDSPKYLLDLSVQKLEILAEYLARLGELSRQLLPEFVSPGFQRFFAMVVEELEAGYLERIAGYLKELQFKGGVLLSARLGSGNRGEGYTIRRPYEQGWLTRLLDRSGYSFTVADRDESGMRALSAIQDRGANTAANALAQSVDHVLGFFLAMRAELAFYIGCLNLYEALEAKDAERCRPLPQQMSRDELTARGLYDVALALTIDAPIVPNDLWGNGRRLVIVTGANQGGKSTFLRAVGQAQLMMQAGMFVGAQAHCASVVRNVFTHYKREEDQSLSGGKLDEELSRMSAIADTIQPRSLLLCNESFAATNEREGSQIAAEVVRAMLDCEIRVVFVTHLFDLAETFNSDDNVNALFLRAERGENGARPFKLIEGAPLPTSYGEDAYRKVFGRGDASNPSVAKELSR